MAGFTASVLATEHVIIEGILDVRSSVLAPEQLFRIGFVFGEEERGFPFAMQVTLSQLSSVALTTGDKLGMDAREGRASSRPHDHRFRNQSVGRT